MGRYGKGVPKPIRHGIADAAQNLYDETALATWDRATAPVRFAAAGRSGRGELLGAS